MAKLIAILIAQFASYASILGLYFTLTPLGGVRPNWHWALLGAAVLVGILLAVNEIREFIRSAPKMYRSQKRINSYLLHWISSGGRVVIFSRDMSWANEDSVRNALREKAERDELIVCLDHAIQLTNELRDCGAQIITYGHLNHTPRARFTIVDFGREGARVCVGVHEKGRQVIQEYRSGFHPFFGVAEDLVRFLIAAEAGSQNVS